MSGMSVRQTLYLRKRVRKATQRMQAQRIKGASWPTAARATTNEGSQRPPWRQRQRPRLQLGRILRTRFQSAINGMLWGPSLGTKSGFAMPAAPTRSHFRVAPKLGLPCPRIGGRLPGKASSGDQSLDWFWPSTATPTQVDSGKNTATRNSFQ